MERSPVEASSFGGEEAPEGSEGIPTRVVRALMLTRPRPTCPKCGMLGYVAAMNHCRRCFTEHIQPGLIEAERKKPRRRRGRKPNPATQARREYMKSAAWAERRATVRRLSADRCAVPGCGGGKITVHHITYVRLGREKLGDLVLLCWPHHRKVHGLESKTVSLLVATARVLGVPTKQLRSHLGTDVPYVRA